MTPQQIHGEFHDWATWWDVLTAIDQAAACVDVILVACRLGVLERLAEQFAPGLWDLVVIEHVPVGLIGYFTDAGDFVATDSYVSSVQRSRFRTL